jgi:hypothetical protein
MQMNASNGMPGWQGNFALPVHKVPSWQATEVMLLGASLPANGPINAQAEQPSSMLCF